MNVLVVDDSALMRGIIRRTIHENSADGSVEVIDASNGEEALAALTARPIDLILLDWNMPVLDGLSFVRQIRADGVRIPIVMVSAVSDEHKIYEACEAGVSDYLEKPVRGSELWERIRGYML